jgi:hypothetical protein
VDVQIHHGNDPSVWRLSFIYGNPDDRERGLFWQNLANRSLFNTLPWICVDDLNDIASNAEKEWRRASPFF